MDTDSNTPAPSEPSDSGKRSRARLLLIIGLVVVILGAGITATILTINANQERAQQETLTAIAVAGQATNTAQVAQARTRQADLATSTAHYFETVSANQTLTQEATDAARTAAAQARETGQAENAAATQSVLDSYQALIDQAQSGPLIFGPTNGAMVRTDDNFVSAYSTGVFVEDFYLEITFENPYSTSTGPLTYGVIFRYTAANYSYRLILQPGGFWTILHADGINNYTETTRGLLVDIEESANGHNRVGLLVQEDLGVLYINDSFIGTFELSERIQPGNIQIATDLITLDFFQPGETRFLDLKIWRLP